MPDAQRLTKIKRAILWIRRNLEITERTDVPELIENVVRPTLDVLGWERLTESVVTAEQAGAPLTQVTFDPGITTGLTYIPHCSVRHSDTGVTHTIALRKVGFPPLVQMGLPLDTNSIVLGEDAAMIGNVWLLPGELLVGRILVPLVVGNLFINVEFINLPDGEYIPGVSP